MPRLVLVCLWFSSIFHIFLCLTSPFILEATQGHGSIPARCESSRITWQSFELLWRLWTGRQGLDSFPVTKNSQKWVLPDSLGQNPSYSPGHIGWLVITCDSCQKLNKIFEDPKFHYLRKATRQMQKWFGREPAVYRLFSRGLKPCEPVSCKALEMILRYGCVSK